MLQHGKVPSLIRKAISLFLTVVFVGSLCGCEDNNDESEPIGNTTGPVASESMTESTHLELTDADFTPIDINYEIIDDAPPIETNVIDLSNLDFGERLSPCKAEEVYKDYLIKDPYQYELEEYTYEDPDFQKYMMTPSKGKIRNATFFDNKYYLLINYDDFCGRHDSSVFSYDVKTGELKEIVRHSGLEKDFNISLLAVAHGRLYYTNTYLEDQGKEYPFIGTVFENGLSESNPIDYNRMKRMTTLYSVDVSGDDEKEECSFEGIVIKIRENGNGLIMDTVSGAKGGYIEYNISTRELRELDYAAVLPDLTEAVLCDGEPAEITGGMTDGEYQPLVIKTQYYTLSTDFLNYTRIFLWKDKVVIVALEYVGTQWLYTYDLTRRELLKMKYDGFGFTNMLQTEEGLLIINNSVEAGDGYSSQRGERMFYLVPLLGMVFRMDSSDKFLLGESSDTVYYLEIKAEKGSVIKLKNPIMYNEIGLPDKLYWLKYQ